MFVVLIDSFRRLFFLSRAELRLALQSFTIKLILFLLIEFVVCQFDRSRTVCRLVERGFVPSLVVFALMDFVVIPRVRRRL